MNEESPLTVVQADGCGGCGKSQRRGAACGQQSSSSVNQLKTCGGEAKEAAEALLPAPEHVLSTLEHDGSRRWMRPKLSMGGFWKARRVVAYALMAIFVAIPHIQIGGKPMILLDIAAREFSILGFTFLPTDTMLLALLMLSVFITVVLVTAITGRAWCGWACPQTVYMEFLFRPIDRFLKAHSARAESPNAKWTVGGALREPAFTSFCQCSSPTRFSPISWASKGSHGGCKVLPCSIPWRFWS